MTKRPSFEEKNKDTGGKKIFLQQQLSQPQQKKEIRLIKERNRVVFAKRLTSRPLFVRRARSCHPKIVLKD